MRLVWALDICRALSFILKEGCLEWPAHRQCYCLWRCAARPDVWLRSGSVWPHSPSGFSIPSYPTSAVRHSRCSCQKHIWLWHFLIWCPPFLPRRQPLSSFSDSQWHQHPWRNVYILVPSMGWVWQTEGSMLWALQSHCRFLLQAQIRILTRALQTHGGGLQTVASPIRGRSFRTLWEHHWSHGRSLSPLQSWWWRTSAVVKYMSENPWPFTLLRNSCIVSVWLPLFFSYAFDQFKSVVSTYVIIDSECGGQLGKAVAFIIPHLSFCIQYILNLVTLSMICMWVPHLQNGELALSHSFWVIHSMFITVHTYSLNTYSLRSIRFHPIS